MIREREKQEIRREMRPAKLRTELSLFRASHDIGPNKSVLETYILPVSSVVDHRRLDFMLLSAIRPIKLSLHQGWKVASQNGKHRQ